MSIAWVAAASQQRPTCYAIRWATLSSWITCARTKWPGRVKRSRPPVRACCSSPPYSPDLNPIEQAFAKLKALLCALGSLGDLTDCFTPQEGANYFRPP